MRHIKNYTDPVQSSAAIGVGAEGADGVDLAGKVIVVTGANAGLGKAISTYAAAKNATLYMLCRSQERAVQAQKEIMELTKNNNVHVVLVDVSELHQIRKVAAELQEREKSIHALVCNAGVLLNERKESSEKNELTFASHLLGGSYLLSQLLLPQLKAAGGDARVIMVTSGGMYNFRLPSWDCLTSAPDVPYNGVNAYAYAKRGQVLLAERMAIQEPEVTWVTAHPGWADTNALDEAFGENVIKYLKPLRDPWEGAEGITWLLSAQTSKLENGALYLDRLVQPKHLAGPFFTEGSYTKNKPQEVDDYMEKLKTAAGL